MYNIFFLLTIIIFGIFLLFINLFGLPGNFILLIILLSVGYLKHFSVVFFILTILCFIGGEVIEALGAQFKISKKYRNFKSFLILFLGIIVGTIISNFIFPGIGLLIGPFLGVLGTILLLEYKDHGNLQIALKESFNGMIGRLYGTMGKIFMGIGMLIIFIINNMRG